jgi:simple sugar transport system permease protein
VTQSQRIGGLVLCLLGGLDLVFAFFSHGQAQFQMSLEGARVNIPTMSLPPTPIAAVLGFVSIGLGAYQATVEISKTMRRLLVGFTVVAFVISFLLWSAAGRQIPMPFIALLQGTVSGAIPLILGAFAGLLCERSGVINIAIEGQLLMGAFGAAIVASFAGLWLGLITGSLAGGLLAAMLAVFAIRYLVDQIILGVVLNVFAAGLTGYLYDRVLVPYQNTLNTPPTFNNIKIPLLGDIPIIGPVLFNATIFLYITYAVFALVQFGLFHTRWGLRVRAVGEHPTAADTVGIRVYLTRYRNVILGGMVAGIGGAYLTIGSVGAFGKDISSGLGYIALAAMIFGRWKPVGATLAALFFGFSTALANVLGTIGSPIPSDILLMLPYVATIVAVAGLVGRVRSPAADGKPYVKA